MKLTKVKTEELTGAALDYAVAVALGWEMVPVPADCNGENAGSTLVPPDFPAAEWSWPVKGKISINAHVPPYSTNWGRGGLLIDAFGPYFNEAHGCIRCSVHDAVQYGATYLNAFCRALVAAKLADVNGNIMIPAELVGEAA